MADSSMKSKRCGGNGRSAWAALLAVVTLAVAVLPSLQIFADGPEIASFAAGDPAYTETVPLGTSADEIDFPETLEAVMKDGSARQIPVTWASADYDADAAGVYMFGAQFSGYTYAAARPYAVITVDETAVKPRRQPGNGDQTAEDALTALVAEVIDRLPDTEAVKGLDKDSEALKRVCADVDLVAALIADLSADGLADLEQAVGAARLAKLNDIFEYLAAQTDALKPQVVRGPRAPIGNDAYISYFNVGVTDGTAPWGSSQKPGSDTGPKNKIVRTYDTVIYNLATSTALYAGKKPYEGERVKYEMILPYTKDQLEPDESLLGWTDKSAGYAYQITQENRMVNGVMTPCQVVTAYKLLEIAEGVPFAVPGQCTVAFGVRVKAMANGAPIQPIFTAKLEHNTEANELRTKTADAVSVSAKLNLNVSLESSNKQLVDQQLDFSTGNAQALDKGTPQERGLLYLRGLAIRMMSPDGDGIKGCELPQGSIQFNLRSSIKLNGSDYSNDAAYYRRVWSYGGNDPAAVGPDGRAQNLCEAGRRPYSEMVPFNHNGGIDSCTDGGNWSVTRVSPTEIHVQVSGYTIDVDHFPKRTAGLTLMESSMRDTSGIISAAELHLWQPLEGFYNFGNVDLTLNSEVHVTDLDAVGQFGSTQKDSPQTADSQPILTDKQDAVQHLKKHVSGGPATYQYIFFTHRDQQPTGQLLSTEGNLLSPFIGNPSSGGLSRLKFGDEFTITFNNCLSGQYGFTGKHFYKVILFDGNILEPTGVNQFDTKDYFISRNTYYLTRANGTSFSTVQAMNNQLYTGTGLKGLKVYKNLSDIPAGHVCVGIFTMVDNTEHRVHDLAVFGMRVKSNVKYSKKGVHVLGRSFCNFVENDHNQTVSLVTTAANSHATITQDFPITTSIGTWLTPGVYTSDGKLVRPPLAGIQTAGTLVWTQSLAGDSAFVNGFGSSIYKSVEQMTSNGLTKVSYLLDFNEAEVDYLLTPQIVGASGAASSTKETVTVKDTLPKELRYKPGSAYYGGTYAMSPLGGGHQGTVSGGVAKEPVVVNNSDGTQTLTWTFPNHQVNQALQKIHYTATIVGGKPNAVVNAVNEATIQLSSDTGTPGPTQKSWSSINIVSLSAESFGKFPEEISISKEQSIFKYHLFNSNTFSSPLPNATLIDTMPYKGDAAGSNFDGYLKVHSFKVDPTYLDLSKMKLYYTTDASYKGKTSQDLTLSQIKSSWTQAVLHPDGTSADMNGKAVVCWALTGELGVKKSMVVDLELEQETAKSKAGDKYVNRASTFGGDPVPSQVRVVEYSISGCTWLDANKDGIQDAVENKIDGLTATLLKLTPGGNPADESDYMVYSPVIGGVPTPITVAVGKQRNVLTGVESAYQTGLYKFTEVPTGVYAVKITDGTIVKLMHYTASPVNQGSDDTADSDGEPTMTNGLLTQSLIKQIKLEAVDATSPAVVEIAHNDAGFFRDNLVFQKLDPQGQILSDAGFTLYEAQPSGTGYTWNSGSPVKPEVKSDVAGLVVFSGVEPNKKYILAETTAPPNYRESTPNDYILVDVSADGSYTLTGYGFFAAAGMISESGGMYQVKNAYAEAKIQIKKVISNYGSYGTELKDHAFMIHLSGDMTASAVLKHGERSGTITHLVDGSSDTVDIVEIVPMEYSGLYTVSSEIHHADGTQETKPGRQLTLLPGDEVTVTVTNTFEHKAYFKDRGFVDNRFEP